MRHTSKSTEAVLDAAAAASSKKAERIVILDVSSLLVITDHFLICSGNTERQVRGISDEIERKLRDERELKPTRREGERESRWIVLDFVDFVVHVFHKEDREYYDLERLWSDAPEIPFEEPWEGTDESASTQATQAS